MTSPADWSGRLAPGPLPIFSHTREALLEQRRAVEQVTAREIAQIILADPYATLHLMHTANQRGGRLGGEVTTAENALMMLGMGRYLDDVRQLPVLEESQFAQDWRLLADLRALARRIHHAAWQARDFAVLHSDVRAEEVQVAAILHATPELLLCLRAPKAARQLYRSRRRGVADAEARSLDGVTLVDLRLPLLDAWKIPELTRDLLDPAQADMSRQRILQAALNLAELAQDGWWNEDLLASYVALAGIDNLPLEFVIATAHANAMRAERAAAWIGSPGAGVWTPMLPGPWPLDPDDEDSAIPAPASAPIRTPAPEPEEEPVHEVCPMPDQTVLREALKNIESHLDGSLNLTQMSAIILKGLHSGLGLTRILFATLTPDGKQIKSRFNLGIPAGEPLRHFVFDLDSRDLFGQLMGKMQGVWVNDGNREKLWPMVHPTLRQLIGVGDFYAMSLHVQGNPFGLIYADRGHGDCGLDPHTYTDFKMLCLQAARGLGRLKTA